MKIRPVGAELLHADGQTNTQYMTTLTLSYRHFAKAPIKMCNQQCQGHDNKTGKGKNTHRQCPETLRTVFGNVRVCSVVTPSTNPPHDLPADSAHASSLDCVWIGVGQTGGREAIVMRRQS